MKGKPDINNPSRIVGNFWLDSPRSAYGELLVAQPHPIFQGSFEYTVSNTSLVTNTTTNGGTVTQADAMAVVSTSTTTASTAKLTTFRHAKYRSGEGGAMRFTALFATPVAGTEQYIGIMDEAGSSEAFKNGYAIGYDGTTFGVHRWQNDSLTTVALADCDDPLDGTGVSGMTIDQTKLNIFFIQYQYHGAGAIKYIIEDAGTGNLITFHTVLYSGLHTVPSVYNPNFKFTVWVDNKGTTSNLIMKTASYAYFVEGKTSFIELHQPQFGTGEKTKSSVTSEVAIFTIRNRAAYASKANFIDVLIEFVAASIEADAANNLGNVRLVKDATLGGTPSYADINTTNSVIEIDTAGTTVTGGIDIFPIPLAGKNDKHLENLVSLKIILQAGETLTLAGSSAATATIKGSCLWKELF